MKKEMTEIRRIGVTRKMQFAKAVGNLVRNRYKGYLQTVGGTASFLNKFLAATRDDSDAAWGYRDEFIELMSSEGIHIELNGLKLDSLLKPIVSMYIDFDLGIGGAWEVCGYYVDLMTSGDVVVTDMLLLGSDGRETKVHGNDLHWDCFTNAIEAAMVFNTENVLALAA